MELHPWDHTYRTPVKRRWWQSSRVKQALIPVGLIGAALVMTSLDRITAAVKATGGGSLLNLPLVPMRWTYLTLSGRVEACTSWLDLPRYLISVPLALPGKAVSTVFGRRLPTLDNPMTIAELSQRSYLWDLAPSLADKNIDLAELVRMPDLPSFAPRIAGLQELSLEKALRMLPKDQQLTLLRRHLGIERVGSEGLEQAILAQLIPSGERPDSLAALLEQPDLARTVLASSRKEVLALLGQSPHERTKLLLGMLGPDERLAVTYEFGQYLPSYPEIVEREAMSYFLPKLRHPPPLHEFLARADWAEKAPRLFGAKEGTCESLFDLLSPDERFHSSLDLSQLKGLHAGLMSFLAAQDLAFSRDQITASPSDSSVFQFLPIMLPMVIAGSKQIWQQLKDITDRAL